MTEVQYQFRISCNSHQSAAAFLGILASRDDDIHVELCLDGGGPYFYMPPVLSGMDNRRKLLEWASNLERPVLLNADGKFVVSRELFEKLRQSARVQLADEGLPEDFGGTTLEEKLLKLYAVAPKAVASDPT
jgi:hypothetical protein